MLHSNKHKITILTVILCLPSTVSFQMFHPLNGCWDRLETTWTSTASATKIYLHNDDLSMGTAPSGGNGHGDNDDAANAANRWSKFAPDANLSTEDFREQLKENMKADLERRRRETPNRGNQPAKSYLDSLSNPNQNQE